LRADNAGLRLTDLGMAWGCVGSPRAAAHRRFRDAVDQAWHRAHAEGATPAQYQAAGMAVNQDGRWRCVLEALALPSGATSPHAIEALFPWLNELPPAVRQELEVRSLYAPYLERQAAAQRLLEREERTALPQGIDFASIPGLSLEMRQRLLAARPATLGSASRIPGITPAALAALAAHVRRTEIRST
jgi:tRNA uridine 5-carboxymethylaminomethyl modification enzyme